MSDLRKHLVRLGSQQPHLRPHLRPILASLGQGSSAPARRTAKARPMGRRAAKHNYSDAFLDRHRDINVDYDWYDYIIEDWTKKLDAMGFDNPEIRFSGFHSQGDGASFTCDQVLVHDFLTKSKLKSQYRQLHDFSKKDGDLVFHIYRPYGSRELHPFSIQAEVLDEVYRRSKPLPPKVDLQMEELAKDMTEMARDLSYRIYRELEDGYEYLTSDEAVAESLMANEIYEDEDEDY